MKKIKLLLCLILTLAFVFTGGVIALADGESTEAEDHAGTTSEETSEAVSAAETDEDVLTEKQIKELLNAYLDEKQQSQAERTAQFIADKFSLDTTTAYVVAVIAIVLIGLILFFAGKVIAGKVKDGKNSEKLKALQAYCQDRDKTIDQLLAITSSLDGDNLDKLVHGAISVAVKNDLPELIKGVAEECHLDTATMDKVVGEVATQTAQINTIIKALQVLALKGNQTEMANVLTEQPIAKAYEKLVAENLKLKTALGEAAYNEVVGK